MELCWGLAGVVSKRVFHCTGCWGAPSSSCSLDLCFLPQLLAPKLGHQTRGVTCQTNPTPGSRALKNSPACHQGSSHSPRMCKCVHFFTAALVALAIGSSPRAGNSDPFSRLPSSCPLPPPQSILAPSHPDALGHRKKSSQGLLPCSAGAGSEPDRLCLGGGAVPFFSSESAAEVQSPEGSRNPGHP